MALTWLRTQVGPLTFPSELGGYLISLNPGETLLRVRFGWTAVAVTSSYADMFTTYGTQIFAGLVTTIGDASESPPSPVISPGDQDPPARRWLWLEGRSMIVNAFPQSDGGTGGLVSAPPAEPTDAKANLRAPQLPEGQFVNLWLSADQSLDWPFGVDWFLYGWANVLVDV